MTTEETIKMAKEIADAMADYNKFRTGGNVGLAMIAAAISEHAAAVRELSVTLGRFATNMQTKVEEKASEE